MDPRSDLGSGRTPRRRPASLVAAANLLIAVPLLLLTSALFLIFVGSILADEFDPAIAPVVLMPVFMLFVGGALYAKIKDGDDVARWTAVGVLVFGVAFGIADLFDGTPSSFVVLALVCAVTIGLLLAKDSARYCGGGARPPRQAVRDVGAAAAGVCLFAALCVVGMDDSEWVKIPVIGYVAGAVVILLASIVVRRSPRIADAGYVVGGVIALSSGIALGVVHAIEQDSLATAGAVPVGLATGVLALAGGLLVDRTQPLPPRRPRDPDHHPADRSDRWLLS